MSERLALIKHLREGTMGLPSALELEAAEFLEHLTAEQGEPVADSATHQVELLESRLAAVFERTRELVRLCREVVSEHADEDSPFFNDCDTDEKRCQWCIDASAAILALAPEASAATQEGGEKKCLGNIHYSNQSDKTHCANCGIELPALTAASNSGVKSADLIPGLERAAEIVGDERISGLRTISDNIYDALRAEINRLKGG